jgi:CHASE3 domain sensor protein
MVDAEKLEQAQVRVAQAQDVLDDVGKVLAAAERAQLAADRAREAADHARDAIRKLNMILPVFAVVLGIVVLLSRRHHRHPSAN